MSEQQDGLQNKFRILSLLPLDRRVGRKHMAVLAFILDWHHRKYGDALASVRHIVGELKTRDPFGKGLYTGDVHSALVDLVAWGYLTQQKGSGRRASRYVPVWGIFDSVLGTPNTTDDNPSVQESPNASVLETPNATDASVLAPPNEDPLTQTRLQDRVTGRDIDCAAPLAVGLEAAAAPALIGGFEELWQAYAYRSEKQTARATYDAMTPDADLHGRLVESAIAWRAAWAAQGRTDAPRKRLHSWLKAEDWDCDPPTGFKAKERKAEKVTVDTHSEPEPAPGNDNDPVPARDFPHYTVWPGAHVGRHTGRVIDHMHSPIRDGERVLEIAVCFSKGPSKGAVASLAFMTDSKDASVLAHGHSQYARLAEAMGKNEMDQPFHLRDIPFDVEIDQWGNAAFSPATPPDSGRVAE